MVKLRSRIHENYEFFFPCNQAVGTGTAIDVSGSGETFFPGSGITDAQMWANAGYLSSRAASNGYLAVPYLGMRRLWTNDTSFIFHCTFKGAAPAGTQGIMGQGRTAGSITGWRLVGFITSGDVRLDVYGMTAGVTITPTLSAKLDSADHHIVIAGDGPSQSISLMMDGVTLISSASFAAAGVITSNQSDLGLGISAPIINDTSAAIQIYGAGYLVFDGRLPDQVGRMASFLNNNRLTPLPHDGWSL